MGTYLLMMRLKFMAGDLTLDWFCGAVACRSHRSSDVNVSKCAKLANR